MSTNAIKLLNIKWVYENSFNDVEIMIKYMRERQMIYIAAKLIGEGC